MKLIVIAISTWIALVWHEAVERIYNRVVKLEGESIDGIHWRAEVVSHAAFYGTAVAAYLGVSHESPLFGVFAALWFVTCLWYSRRLITRVDELEEHLEKIQWRKTAGMHRDIVKSEIAKALKSMDRDPPGC